MRLLILLFIVFLSPAFAWAGQLDAAENAFYREDYATAFKLFQPLAEEGDLKAQLYLGQLYDSGVTNEKEVSEVIVPQDDAEAFKWFAKAAEQGNMFAQQKLSTMYSMGIGTKKDTAQAERWHSKATEKSFFAPPPTRQLYAETPQKGYVHPAQGEIPDEVTARQVGEAILKAHLGEDSFKHYQPYSASLVGDVW